MTAPLTTIILVNWNGFEDTIECLTSLKAQVGVNYHALVIDNGSHNNSVARIREAHPETEILETGENLGFCGGNNVGIRHALSQGCDYVFLVNNDTVMEPDCLRKLLECAVDRPDAAIIAPAMYFYSDRKKPCFTGSSLDWNTGMVLEETRDVQKEQIQEPFELPWITGCAMLILEARMRELVGFDESFFCYYEDVDLSVRAVRAGYTCLLCPTALLYHKINASSDSFGKKGSKYYYDARNSLLFLSKNAVEEKQKVIRRRAKASVKYALKILRHHHKMGISRWIAIAYFLGVLDFYRKRVGQCKYKWL